MLEAILEGGYQWEEDVVRFHLGEPAHVAPGRGPIRERVHSVERTLELLASLEPGDSIYQGTLLPPAAFLDRYGLDGSLVRFRACRPDIIHRVSSREPLFRIIDIKASDSLKASHKVQASLYALMLQSILEHAGLDGSVDLSTAGIWLYERPEPEWFDLSLTTGVVESFLRDRLQQILRKSASEAAWHLYYRCEMCEYFDGCRREAHETQSVSLVPYLTVGGRTHLRTVSWSDGEGVDSLADLERFLRQPEADALLDPCGSLRGRRERLKHAVSALNGGQVVLHGGSSVALPVHANVRIVITAQREPISGRVYALGLRRLMGKAVFGSGSDEQIWVAYRPEESTHIRSEFIRALHSTLQTVHDFNQDKEWAAQKSVQTYVFDAYENSLFNELLVDAASDPELGPLALQLLFHYQSESLADQDDHPGTQIPFPLITLVSTIRHLVALPSPVVYRMHEVSTALPAASFEYQLESSDLFSFELSNALKSDALFMLWNDGNEEASNWIRQEIRKRLLATSSIVDGLRERVGDSLFAWPPKFRLPAAMPFNHPELSRLAFVVQYESFSGALATRAERARPWDERISERISIPITRENESWWRPDIEVDSSEIEADGFLNRLLVPAGRDGERAQMAFDDFRHRRRMWALKKGVVALAGVTDVRVDPATGKVIALEIGQLRAPAESPPPSNSAVLHRRFTDFTSTRIVDRLRALDATTSSDFVALLRAPSTFASAFNEPPGVVATAMSAAKRSGLTPSQAKSFEHLLSKRFTQIWGPPGTGKTHFLARALLCLFAGRVEEEVPLRVAVTAFTHAATENLLREIHDIASSEGWVCPRIVKLKAIHSPRGEPITTVDEKQVAKFESSESAFVGGTIYSLAKAVGQGFAPCDLLVVDEASQMKLGELALATVALAEGGRLVLAGDHLQLPPIIQGSYPDPEDGLAGMEDSAFAYFADRDDPEAPFTRQLSENWRMNQTLSRFSAEALYGPDYRPATPQVAERQLRLIPSTSSSELTDLILAPESSLVACVLEGVHAAAENSVEASLVAQIASALRERVLVGDRTTALPDTTEGDRCFWTDALFVVSPHHVQIRAIKRELGARRQWKHPPFVDTVDKMQGQQCEAVIVSYGVSDTETALREADFIYSLNRLNVSVTRAKSKCVVFLPRPLLEPSFELLSSEAASAGLGYMHKFTEYCRAGSSSGAFELQSLGYPSSGRLVVWAR